MDKNKRTALEAGGWRFGNAEDFLGLTEAERRMMELRLKVGRVVRERRQSQGLTQQQVASRINTSQSRIAKIETAAPGVSLDLMVKSLFALGGVFDLELITAGAAVQTRAKRGKAKVGR